MPVLRRNVLTGQSPGCGLISFPCPLCVGIAFHGIDGNALRHGPLERLEKWDFSGEYGHVDGDELRPKFFSFLLAGWNLHDQDPEIDRVRLAQFLEGEHERVGIERIGGRWNHQQITALGQRLEVVWAGVGFGVDDDVAAPSAIVGGVFRALEDVGYLEGHPAFGAPDKGLTVRVAVEQQRRRKPLEVGGEVNGGCRLGNPAFEAGDGDNHAAENSRISELHTA